MAIEISKKPRSKMYECQAFFPEGQTPKKWKYVTDLKRFSEFLAHVHSSWKYFNVYEKATKKYVKRFYPGNEVPKVLSVLALFLLFSPLTDGKDGQSLHQYPLKNTTNKTTSGTSTSILDYYATIPTSQDGKKEGACTL